MSEASVMDEGNPYSAPGATLSTASDDTQYQPSFLSFSGRIGRLRYLAYGMGASLILMAVMVPLMMLTGGAMAMSGGEPGIGAIVLFLLISIVSIVISVMFGKRRFNDLNRSGWWSILLFIPYIQLLPILYLLFFPGSQGSNDYGPEPVANTTGVVLLALAPIFVAILGIVAAILIPMFAGGAPQ